MKKIFTIVTDDDVTSAANEVTRGRIFGESLVNNTSSLEDLKLRLEQDAEECGNCSTCRGRRYCFTFMALEAI